MWPLRWERGFSFAWHGVNGWVFILDLLSLEVYIVINTIISFIMTSDDIGELGCKGYL